MSSEKSTVIVASPSRQRRWASMLLVAVLAVGIIFNASTRDQAAAAVQTSGGWTTKATSSPSTVAPGSTVTVTVTVTSATTRRALVDLEVYSATGRVYQHAWDGQSFTAGKTRTFSIAWPIPASEATGTHTVRVGIFGAGWGPLQHWNNTAGQFAVTATTTTVPPTTTTVPPTTTTVAPTTTTVAPTTTTTVVTGPPDAVFADGFDSGNVTAWSSAVTNGGKLSVTAAAARAGTFGLQAQVSGTTGMYVADTTPTALASYHARFAYAPNSISITSGRTHDLLDVLDAANTAQATVQVTKNNGNYQIRATARSGSSTKTTSWYTISNATHSIEIAWQSATASGGTNGTLTLWIDGVAKQTVTGLANSSARIATARLGPQNIGSGITGTEYLDSFASTRTAYIGP